MQITLFTSGASLMGAILLLAACGVPITEGAGNTALFTIGGTVSGLAAGSYVTLLNNGADALTIAADGPFTFAAPIAGGAPFSVTIQSHGPAIACSLANAASTAGTADVTNVVVTCAPGIETVLYSFGVNPDANTSYSELVMDGAGHLYGTSFYGGANTCGVYTCGTVFKIDTSGHETVLHSFAGSDGQNPSAGLIIDSAGNLYGTTQSGGANGTGTVFKVTPSGVESVLYSFGPVGLDGRNPRDRLVMDGASNLYGTTPIGGANGTGIVFKLSPSGIETILHSFGPSTSLDGQNPFGRLAIDSAGNLYGSTWGGGNNSTRTVFKVTASGNESVLYSFGPFTGADGIQTEAGLIVDSGGNLYGTTSIGGSNGTGTVFKVTPSGTETVLHSFGPTASSDGIYPQSDLILDGAGNLYGTTYVGGTYNAGTVFQISSSGTESVLYSFGTNSPTDGRNPTRGLLLDSAGNLYGTTLSGGAHGSGTVFMIN